MPTTRAPLAKAVASLVIILSSAAAAFFSWREHVIDGPGWKGRSHRLNSGRGPLALSNVTLVLFVGFAIRPGATSEVLVSPNDDLAALVRNAPSTTSFVLLPGRHYSGDIQPKDNQRFDGRPGAILSGAIQLGPFKQEGARWRAPGPPPLAPSHGSCDAKIAAGSDGCLLREALFIDDVPIRRLVAKEQLHDNTWYQDRLTGEIFLGFDPGTHLIEMSYRPAAFYGPAQDVSIRGLIIQHYASPAQHGAIQAYDPNDRALSSGWTIVGNTVRFNSGSGIRTGNRMLIRSNTIIENGQIGVTGTGVRLIIEGNEIARNNTHGFSADWEAGGTKFVLTDGLVFSQNCVRDNMGPGIWMDIENKNSTIVNNWSINNAGAGIYNEISGQAVIMGNFSALNGFAKSSPWGSQILVSGSINTMVLLNHVEVSPSYGHGIFVVEENRSNELKTIHNLPTYASRNNLIAKNQIVFFGAAGGSGFFSSIGNIKDLVSFNQFEDNEIKVMEGEPRRFRFGAETVDWNEARMRGQEIRSRFSFEGRSSFAKQPHRECPSNIRP